MAQKPDDWRVVPLCKGPHANVDGQLGCHDRQHIIGEPEFWRQYRALHGQTVWELLLDFIKASPKRHEIEQVQRERGDSLTSARAAE